MTAEVWDAQPIPPPLFADYDYNYWYTHHQHIGYALPYPAPPPISLQTISADELEEHLRCLASCYQQLGDEQLPCPASVQAERCQEAEIAWFEGQGIPENAILYNETPSRCFLPPNWVQHI